ncbi:MAG: thiosulfate oxidation carrier complex protein SoxZ [Burkholderiales bacterium]|nr:thiosulfate oxidation carrier complex protein SoxZ [Burkholderiales bacterium]
MGKPMKLRARKTGDTTDVRVLMRHDMETGLRKDADGEVIAAHYIQNVTVRHEQRIVLHAQWGAAISKNPYLAFKFAGGAAGDIVEVTWVDNKGDARTDQTNIT